MSLQVNRTYLHNLYHLPIPFLSLITMPVVTIVGTQKITTYYEPVVTRLHNPSAHYMQERMNKRPDSWRNV